MDVLFIVNHKAVEGLCADDKCKVCSNNCHPEETCKELHKDDASALETCVSQFYQAVCAITRVLRVLMND